MIAMTTDDRGSIGSHSGSWYHKIPYGLGSRRSLRKVKCLEHASLEYPTRDLRLIQCFCFDSLCGTNPTLQPEGHHTVVHNMWQQVVQYSTGTLGVEVMIQL